MCAARGERAAAARSCTAFFGASRLQNTQREEKRKHQGDMRARAEFYLPTPAVCFSQLRPFRRVLIAGQQAGLGFLPPQARVRTTSGQFPADPKPPIHSENVFKLLQVFGKIR